MSIFDIFTDGKKQDGKTERFFGIRISGPVGNNMENRDGDVRTVRTSLDTVNDRPEREREKDYTGAPLGLSTQRLHDDIYDFQKRNDLKADGYLNPGGETITALAQRLLEKNSRRDVGRERERSPYIINIRDEAGLRPAASELELAVPPPPDYRKEVFKGKRRNEWEDFYRNVEIRPSMSGKEKRIIQDIFAAEGGMDTHSGSGAYAGILPRTLEKHIKQGKVPNLVKKRGDKVKNTELDFDDLVEVYKSHLNDTMSSAIKGHNDRNPDDQADAMKLLGRLNNKVGDTVADTLFKNGTKKGPEFIIKAVNANLPKDKQLTGPSGIGSKTYQALQDISSDPKKAKSFLESLAYIRSREEENGKNELDRIYHYLNKKY